MKINTSLYLVLCSAVEFNARYNAAYVPRGDDGNRFRDVIALVNEGMLVSDGKPVVQEGFNITPLGLKAYEEFQRENMGYFGPQKKQRCNHCMTVQAEENTECEKCGRDDALMFPFEGAGS